MQTVHLPLSAMNGAPPMTTLSHPSSTLHFSQTISPHIPRQVYEIPSSPASGKCSPGEEHSATYTTQYYTTLHPHSRDSSPIMLNAEDNPDLDTGNISPRSNSTKESSSDSESSSVDGGDMECLVVEQDMGECISSLSDSGTGSMVGGEGAVKHWTYEDQFKQLYNLSPEKERREFLDKLFTYMQNKGTPITRIPIMAKQPLDLYKLFKLVVERGGLVEVIKKKAWRNVAKELNLPASITSAAFTMRSQYVKYLYPYECEVAKLSNPQELQVAIESNKRDRRHSDTVEFLSPQLTCRTDLEQAVSPVQRVSNTQGLQLITSPTVAIPHGSLPPYSGGFIVAGSGGAHQVVQMAHHIPGIPIVVPGSSVASGHAQSGVIWTGKGPTEDREQPKEDSSESTIPPSKKLALDLGAGKVTLTNSRIHPGVGGFIMTPSGSIVPHPGPTPHLIQMAAPGQPQIPIVIPSSVSTSTTVQRDTALKQSESVVTENGSTRSHVSGGVASTTHYKEYLTSASRPPHSSNVIQMSPQFAGLVLPPVTSALGGRTTSSSESEGGQRTAVQEIERVWSPEQQREGTSTPTALKKMPFANISIRSAGKSEGGEDTADSSLLVSLEINNVQYQGVLFAKPKQGLATTSSSDR